MSLYNLDFLLTKLRSTRTSASHALVILRQCCGSSQQLQETIEILFLPVWDTRQLASNVVIKNKFHSPFYPLKLVIYLNRFWIRSKCQYMWNSYVFLFQICAKILWIWRKLCLFLGFLLFFLKIKFKYANSEFLNVRFDIVKVGK